MAQADGSLGCRADEELVERVEQYREECGYEHRSEAVRDLLRTGLREQRHPLLVRWREQVINWAGLLGVFALVFLAGGVATPAMSAYHGYLMSLVLVSMAAGLVGILELARALTGQSRLGAFIREVRQ